MARLVRLHDRSKSDGRLSVSIKPQKRDLLSDALVGYLICLAVEVSNTYTAMSKGSASVRRILLTARLGGMSSRVCSDL